MSNPTQDLIYQNEELKALLTNAEAELAEAQAEQYRFREQLETLQFAFAKVTAERDGLLAEKAALVEALRGLSARSRRCP